jgi:fucose 4-O-acetylase-like acetyltransferase
VERDQRIDTLKGVLITLVVFGHCFKYGSPTDGVKVTVSNWIYLFHMPFFVFLSGYFTHPRSKTFWNGVLAIAESYVVYQLIKGVLAGYSPIELLTTPAPMMWYLLALIVWRSIYYLIDKFKRPAALDWGILLLLIVLGLAVGFNSNFDRTFALSRLTVFLPFFWLGTMMQEKDFVGYCKKIPLWIALAIVVLTVGIVIWLSPMGWLNLRETVRCASGYAADNPMVGFYSRVLYYVVAVLLSMAVTKLVTESKLMNQIGKDTLKFYLFHSIALPFMELLKLPWNWYFSILYGIGLMFVFFFFNKTKLSDFAIRPISYVINHIKSKKTIVKNG